jgi:hypothetical protein
MYDSANQLWVIEPFFVSLKIPTLNVFINSKQLKLSTRTWHVTNFVECDEVVHIRFRGHDACGTYMRETAFAYLLYLN